MLRKNLILMLITTLIFVMIPTAYQQDGGALAPDGETGITYYAPISVDITLDGEIDDWEGVPQVRMSGNDHTVAFAATANEENLFLLADVTDSNIVSGEHGVDYWNEDSIEFYINATSDLRLRSYTDGVAQITVPALNKDLPSEEAILAGVRGSTVNATVEVVETDAGYRIEMSLPLENDVWSINPAHGTALGFQIHLNGTSASARDTKLIWSAADTNDQSYLNPSVFGFLVFYEIGETDVPVVEAIEEATNVEIVQVNDSALYKNGNLPPEARVIDLMSRMTLDEKIAQMTLVEKNSLTIEDLTFFNLGGILSGGGGYPQGNNTPEGWAEMVDGYQDASMQSRLAIPMIYGVDAVHGHSNVEGAVIFPHNIGLGATRNADLIQEICRVTAEEMIATGIYWNYSPVMAVAQDVRWGRTYEAYGQNTDLVTELSNACLVGLQGDDIGDPLTVVGTPKHYLGDGGAQWGTSTTGDYMIDQGDTIVDEETLRTVHLPPYIEAMENDAQIIMISYSAWNGERLHGQAYLINDVLKGELGFEGFIVSDWAGVDMVSDDYYDAVVQSINAGVDMNMVPYNYFLFMDTLKRAVNAGDVPMERIDDAVRRILLTKFEMGLFENAYSNPELLDSVGSEEHRAVARQAVAESQVLLKNDGDVLPLSPESETIYVAGAGADDIGIQSGGWTIEWQGAVGEITEGTTILEGIEASVSDNTTVEYSENGTFEGTAEVGVVVVGELPYAEGIGDDSELTLSEDDLATIAAMQESVDQVVVIILSGRPLIITEHIDDWDAVVAAWLPGTEGNGVSDPLFGYTDYAGQLSFDWMASVDQLPIPIEDPLFEYGFGLTTEATQN